jgi:hypothetical protein
MRSVSVDAGNIRASRRRVQACAVRPRAGAAVPGVRAATYAIIGRSACPPASSPHDEVQYGIGVMRAIDALGPRRDPALRSGPMRTSADVSARGRFLLRRSAHGRKASRCPVPVLAGTGFGGLGSARTSRTPHEMLPKRLRMGTSQSSQKTRRARAIVRSPNSLPCCGCGQIMEPAAGSARRSPASRQLPTERSPRFGRHL